jgi:hypothetical protein
VSVDNEAAVGGEAMPCDGERAHSSTRSTSGVAMWCARRDLPEQRPGDARREQAVCKMQCAEVSVPTSPSINRILGFALMKMPLPPVMM